MKPLNIIAAGACIALSLTPLSFGVVAQSLVPVKWNSQDVAPKPIIRKGTNTETALVDSLVKILESRPTDALKAIDAVIAENPNFRLAHLIKGDLLLARSQALSTLGNTSKAGTTVNEMREEAKARLAHHLNAPPLNLAPQQILKMSADQPYALLVDTSRSRLYVYKNQNGQPRYVTDYYVSSGKNGAEKFREGDQKTPIGVYNVVGHLPRSQLSDFYGPGAFPISYPNEWDRIEGKKGHGIWLHGTPSDTYSRSPRSSNGCVVLANQDLEDLAKYVRIGVTPVIINAKAEWVEPEKWQGERERVLTALETWRRDWESRDTKRYISHYHQRFVGEGKDLARWTAQKRVANSSKDRTIVDIANVSIYAYPGVKNMVVVSFDQDYRSNNVSNQTKKRQYWIKENYRWQIVFEGDVESPPTWIAKRS
jgi:murein L,D-transpeptidase YafK